MEILSVKEVAQYLHCSVSAIRSLVRKKSIPCFRIGTKINFAKNAIDDWIREQELLNMENGLEG